MRVIILGALFFSIACSPQMTLAPQPNLTQSSNMQVLVAKDLPKRFVMAVRSMRPVLVKTCLKLREDRNCDFVISVNLDPMSPPNAFQTVDEKGRPLLLFSITLIDDMKNVDEIAFVIGHEGAHHILGHLEHQKKSAAGGATLFEVLAAALGGSTQSVGAASDIGAAVGARNYSKTYELEADRLGAQMTLTGGFDPVIGASYFTRIPDPGNKFLGTHPPNRDRILAVRTAVGR
jgi:Zn-dependent protease with chaperone function